ncbi:unnamed protein product [Closterium sp. NIES-64]|nr:unnamed protein product [Closterium sp. NIES-64]
MLTPSVRQAAKAALVGVGTPTLLTRTGRRNEGRRAAPLRGTTPTSSSPSATAASTSATTATSAPTAAAATASASAAATTTTAPATTPTATHSLRRLHRTSTAPDSSTCALAPLALARSASPARGRRRADRLKTKQVGSSSRGNRGQQGEGEHPSKMGVRGSPREAPTATMLFSAARRASEEVNSESGGTD